jgi:hypothetical protein
VNLLHRRGGLDGALVRQQRLDPRQRGEGGGKVFRPSAPR